MSLPAASFLMLHLALGAFAPQQAGSEPLPAEQEARVQQLGKLLRCAVCQGLSITDSPASMARAQLDKVRALVSEGKTDEEIRTYFVARYGEWVLLSPPKHGFNWIVWLGPGLLLLLGGIVIAKALQGGPSGPPPPTPTPSDDAYLKAVREEVDS